MRKIVLVIFSTLLLIGCVDYRAKLHNSKKLLQVGKQTVTEADLYEQLLKTYGAEAVATIINDYIYSQVADPDEDFSKQVEELTEFYRMLYTDTYYEAAGFDSESEFQEKYIIQDLKLESITKKYIDTNFGSVITAYLPTKLAILQFEDFDEAAAALAEAKAGAPLASLYEKFAATEDYDGEVMIYSNISGLPTEVASYGLNAEKANLVDSPIVSTDGSFYLVQVIDVDRNSFQEEIIEELSGETALRSDAIYFYCDKFNLTYYDKTLIEIISSANPNYLR